MIVSDFTKRALAYRKARLEFLRQGYEEVGEGGGRLWELCRGYRTNCQIVDVHIAPGGKSLFVKIEPVLQKTVDAPRETLHHSV